MAATLPQLGKTAACACGMYTPTAALPGAPSPQPKGKRNRPASDLEIYQGLSLIVCIYGGAVPASLLLLASTPLRSGGGGVRGGDKHHLSSGLNVLK